MLKIYYSHFFTQNENNELYTKSPLFSFNYFKRLSIAPHNISSLFGFALFLGFANQLISGTMLAFSLLPETMLVSPVREEEDVENFYIDDFFWLHERGVDYLFVLFFLHLGRKLYLITYSFEQESAWKKGVFIFLLFQVVVFSGIALCCSHLSEVTLTIAYNAAASFMLFIGKASWWVFTDGTLNTDTLLRLAYLHYVLAYFTSYLGFDHGIDMHYDWKSDYIADGVLPLMKWFDEALSNELGLVKLALLTFFFVEYLCYEEPFTLSYEIFTWGDIGLVNDIRFYGVAPHWYFRAYMSWLIVCPYHYLGIFGLIFFFFSLYFQPNFLDDKTLNRYRIISTDFINFTVIFWSAFIFTANFFTKFTFSWKKIVENFNVSFKKQVASIVLKKKFTLDRVEAASSVYFKVSYILLIMAVLYVSSYLPYGRFFNRLGGNFATLVSYAYIFSYLNFSCFRSLYAYLALKTMLISKGSFFSPKSI